MLLAGAAATMPGVVCSRSSLEVLLAGAAATTPGMVRPRLPPLAGALSQVALALTTLRAAAKRKWLGRGGP